MSKISVKNIAGETVKERELSPALFDMPANDALVHQVYVALAANRRDPIAHTKDRGERSGSGIKPWRQKGTGRARVGSVRSPLWRKGGVTFGPTKEQNFSKQSNRKMRQKAVLVALSGKFRAGKLVVVDTFSFTETKTKRFAEALGHWGIAGKSVLVGLSSVERNTARMVRNIPRTETTGADLLNVWELLNREYLVLSEAGIAQLEDRFKEWDKQKA